MDFKQILKTNAEKAEAWFTEALNALDTSVTLRDAMMYSLSAGGKRLRPTLCIETARLFGADPDFALPAACCLEMVHTASLIHDDMPAMDNDDYRRGRLTNHKVFGEGTALLAGETLFMLPFSLLVKAYGPELGGILCAELADACGPEGMMDGQMIDLESEGKAIEYDTLKRMHARKTGALLRASVRMGALLGQEKDPDKLSAITEFAEHLGLVFQITDDILDVTGDFEKLGKMPGRDEKEHKTTYVTLYGMEQSLMMAMTYGEAAERALMEFDEAESRFHLELIKFLIARDH